MPQFLSSIHASITAAMLAAAPVMAAEPGQRGPEPRASLVLSLTRPGDAARIEAMLPDPALARPARRAVSDIAVLLTSDNGNIDQALGLMNGVPGSARLFRARLIAVIGGRLYPRASAVCGGWQADVSVCRVACDGGIFALKRSGREEPKLRLLLGSNTAAAEPEDARTGVLVSACERDTGPEVRLVPSGTASAAEVELSAE